MHVNLCGRNAFMPQHLLNCAQVCSVLKQMRSKGVPESMRTDTFSDTYLLRQTFDDHKHHISCDLFASPVKKNSVFKTLLYRYGCSDMPEIQLNQPDVLFIDGNISLLISFADNPHKTFVKKEIWRSLA